MTTCPYGKDCELYHTCTLKHVGQCVLSRRPVGTSGRSHH